MEEPKITTVTKEKNPLRVAQGKRLAAVSREAKAKKARERQEHIERQEGSGILPYFVPFSLIVITTGAFGGYHYLKKEEVPVKEEPPKQEENVIKRVSRIENFR